MIMNFCVKVWGETVITNYKQLSSGDENLSEFHNNVTGAPNEKKIGKKPYDAVFCFPVSFYGLLKGYLYELILFDLFGCGS